MSPKSNGFVQLPLRIKHIGTSCDVLLYGKTFVLQHTVFVERCVFMMHDCQ